MHIWHKWHVGCRVSSIWETRPPAFGRSETASQVVAFFFFVEAASQVYGRRGLLVPRRSRVSGIWETRPSCSSSKPRLRYMGDAAFFFFVEAASQVYGRHGQPYPARFTHLAYYLSLLLWLANTYLQRQLLVRRWTHP
jgi:hypothetical protein